MKTKEEEGQMASPHVQKESEKELYIMEKKFQCRIGSGESGLTVKQILTRKWHLGSGQIKKAKFRENGITVDGKQVTVRYILSEGENLEVLIEDKAHGSNHLIPMEGELHILYEDADILVVEKPAGIVCHPSAGHYCDSMANLLVGYFAAKGEGYVVRLEGRLDKGTSGILLYAKHAPALTELERQRKDGRLQKTYHAILKGCPRHLTGEIREPIGKDPDVPMKQRVCPESEGGLPSVTRYRIMEAAADRSWSLAEVTIETGRTHQIRTHMAWLGCPLVGDEMYGETSDSSKLKRPALHAGRLEFDHPVSGERLHFEIPMPEDMREWYLKRRGSVSGN